MKRLIIATNNSGKMKEIEKLLDGCGYEILSLRDAGINKDIEENGKSFEENSLIKARTIHKLTGEMVIADDSGLEIDFLNGAPGIYSARFLGGESYIYRNNGILVLLDGVPQEYRTARFRCVASLVADKTEMTFNGTVEGSIAFEARGTNGFGYDPIFYVPEYGKTMAELDEDIKNRISHRGKAFRLLAEKIKSWGIYGQELSY